MYTPDLLTMTDGTPVTSPAQWEAPEGAAGHPRAGAVRHVSAAGHRIRAGNSAVNTRLRRTRHAGDARSPL